MGSMKSGIAPLAVCLSVLAGSAYAQAPPSLNLGIYYWGGDPAPGSISEGVNAIAAMGSHIARLAISARMNIDYNVSSSCIANFTLTQALEDPDVKQALDNPAISVYVLTAYDGVTFPDCVSHLYLDPSTYTPFTSRQIVGEYSDLTYYLYTTYRTTNKRFIISNWESDNDVYCASADGYATDLTVRANCNAG